MKGHFRMFFLRIVFHNGLFVFALNRMGNENSKPGEAIPPTQIQEKLLQAPGKRSALIQNEDLYLALNDKRVLCINLPVFVVCDITWDMFIDQLVDVQPTTQSVTYREDLGELEKLKDGAKLVATIKQKLAEDAAEADGKDEAEEDPTTEIRARLEEEVGQLVWSCDLVSTRRYYLMAYKAGGFRSVSITESGSSPVTQDLQSQECWQVFTANSIDVEGGKYVNVEEVKSVSETAYTVLLGGGEAAQKLRDEEKTEGWKEEEGVEKVGV